MDKIIHLASHKDPSRALTRQEAIELLNLLPNGAVIIDRNGFLATLNTSPNPVTVLGAWCNDF